MRVEIFSFASKVGMKQRYLCIVQDAVVETVISFERDSTLAMADSAIAILPELPVESLFSNHALEIQNGFEAVEKADPSNGFVFLMLLICAAVTVYLQRNSEGIFGVIFKSSFDRNQALQDARVENSQRSRNMFILQIISILSISLFVAGGIFSSYETTTNIVGLFLSALGIVASLILVKKLVNWLLASMFDFQQELKLYHFNLDIFLASSGILLLPLILVLFFSPQIPTVVSVYTGLGIIGFFYLKGWQRGFSIAMNSSSVSAVHLFYYFCALEILPLFLMIRIAQGFQ